MNAEKPEAGSGGLLLSLVTGVQRHALWVVLAALLLGAGLLVYTKNHLSVDTNNQNMLSPELDWRKAEAEMDRLFPSAGSLVAVIDADTPELADDAQKRLVDKLRGQTELFSAVAATELEPYFRRNGLMFFGEDELQGLADGLTQAQPFLGALNNDPSLHGLFTLLDRAVTHGGDDFDMSAPMGKIADGVQAATDGRFAQLSWQGMLGAPERPDAKRRFVQITPVRNFSTLLPAEKPIAGVRAVIDELKLDAAHGVQVRLTGSVALEHEELQVAFTGMGLAFGVAMIMVVILLYWALRSVRLMVAAVVTLLYGLLATAAFAGAAVGHINMISVAFSMLYVGLGLDYALYLCMQYRELIAQGQTHEQALPRSAGDVGGFMLVCAMTTSLGFFAFIPTPFDGIAELGLISGVGMFISLALSLTLLPALISIMPPDAQKIRLKPVQNAALARILTWPYEHARKIWVGAVILAIGCLLLAPKAYFDYDPINLRDPKSESVSTYRDLVKDPNIPTLSLSVAARDAAEAQALSKQLGELPLVLRAINMTDFVPRDQEAKLSIIEDLSFALGPALSGGGDLKIVAHDDDRKAIDGLREALPRYAQEQGGKKGEAAKELAQQLDRFAAALDKADAKTREALMARLRETLLATVPAQLDSLKTSLQAAPVTEADIPPAMVTQWKSADGHYRVEVWPKARMDSRENIEAFVGQVRGAQPGAVGSAVGMMEAGHAVVGAFRQAFLYSFIAITLLLLVLLRSFKDTLLVLVPLTLAGLLTIASSVLLNIPFNFANVIALPLILGVGVDYGVYLVQRGRKAAAGTNILQTSTARAVLFGALITMANFGNLALAKHPGMVSMGLLLTVGLGMTLICALVLLPSLLARRNVTRP